MNILLALMLFSAPAKAVEGTAAPEVVPVSVGIEVGNFEEDAQTISEKLRQMKIRYIIIDNRPCNIVRI